MARLQFPIGRQRLTPNVRGSEAASTRDVRRQMQQILDNAKDVIQAIEGNSPAALIYAVQPIYDESQELVPVDTGKLKDSGFVEVRSTTRGATAVVGYAKGGDPDYAVWVHEHLEVHHEPPTQAKFLEEAVNRHIEEVPERYAYFVKNSLGL